MDNITTNYQYREILGWHDVPADIQMSEFDYLETEEEQDDAQFFKYRDSYYSLDQVMRMDDDFWHGSFAFGYFAGLVVKISDCGDGILVGYYAN